MYKENNGRHELHHPVTEESAREYVEKTAPSDATDAEKDQSVRVLVEGAAANQAWRDSRDPIDKVRTHGEPFATHDPEDETPEEDDDNADA